MGSRPDPSPRLLGVSSGSGCGVLLGIFPLGVNGRLAEAYEEAQASAGKRDVTDTKIRETWYGIPPFVTVLCTEIKETGIQ